MQQGHVLRRLCRQGNVDLVSQMIDAGVAVDSQQEDGCTGLWLAAEHGAVEVVRLLLAKKASPHVSKTAGNISALFIASQNGHREVVDLLLHHGANPNVCKTSGASPLFIASQQNHPDIVRSLLRAGAHHSTSTTSGVTPLMIAAYQGNLQCVRSLLAAGADPNVVAQGKNAVEWAAENGHRALVEEAIFDHLRGVQAEVKRRRDVEVSSTPRVARGQPEATEAASTAKKSEVTFPGTSIAASPGASQFAGTPHSSSAHNRSASAYAAAAPVDQRSTTRHVNTRSFSEPLPSHVGNMSAVATSGGVTSIAMEEEKRRSAAFRSAVRRDTVATRPRKEAAWVTGGGHTANERSVYATEQEWRAYRERLDALEQTSSQAHGHLADEWMYSPAVTERYAEQQRDLRRRMIDAARANREQLEQSKRSAADVGFVFPRLPEEKMSRLKQFMSDGRGARGPPPPLEPEPEPVPQQSAASPASFAPSSPAFSPSASMSAASPATPASPAGMSALERARARRKAAGK